MRKETQKIASAFLNKRPAAAARSTTDGDALLLHGHKIAWHTKIAGMPVIAFNMRGYGTVTTRDRINGVLKLLGKGGVYQRNHKQHYSGPELKAESWTAASHEVFDVDRVIDDSETVYVPVK